MKKILFLNPPYSEIVLRSYWCGQTSKASYLVPLLDFIILSSFLKNDYELILVDAIKDGLDKADVLKKINYFRPDYIISLTTQLTWSQDQEMFRHLFQLGHKLIILGDLTLDKNADFLREHLFIHGFLQDFYNKDILAIINNIPKDLISAGYREGELIHYTKKSNRLRDLDIPIPKHELFYNNGYSYPFVKSKKFVAMLTDYGCPYKCTFCVMSTLDYKSRSVSNIIDEMKYLKDIGVRDIYFADQAFGALKKRNTELLQSMISHKFNFRWVCYSRVDNIDENFLILMKEAGCHTIMFGVESANQAVLDNYKKEYNLDQIKATFKLCQKYKIRTVGTFLLGFPEDTFETCMETINLAIEIKCDYVSFNFAFPRSNTELREVMLREKLVDESISTSDQGGNEIAIKTRTLSSMELSQLKRIAIRKFYFRPSYLIKQLIDIRSFEEFRIKVSNGLMLFKKIIS